MQTEIKEKSGVDKGQHTERQRRGCKLEYEVGAQVKTEIKCQKEDEKQGGVSC